AVVQISDQFHFTAEDYHAHTVATAELSQKLLRRTFDQHYLVGGRARDVKEEHQSKRLFARRKMGYLLYHAVLIDYEIPSFERSDGEAVRICDGCRERHQVGLELDRLILITLGRWFLAGRFTPDGQHQKQ